ncbi:hypothetical protein BJ684DRAFT_21342 [Piptocephalis cylindrospora]|uniref:CBF1-interacting co-repressor CIR N-terminal domain-containing protein n=1 Tax=Piptocephalis cylindrospora TaxID=1907219 RepID=A0A4P9Y043_9FUNG|nr:hypothetical protein BJ684DRAFT_21342 [Piptocephalis cylindrospora]|eukprot:RKP12095.1 hypothetical protein BJ684DRAFT_21342 [Piptocephalis cylindrospora]
MNILPKKSWHVYSAKNKERVRKDEEKAREEQNAKERRHQEAESEYRFEVLRRRVRRGTTSEEYPSTASEGARASDDAVRRDRFGYVLAQSSRSENPINFWKEEEHKDTARKHDIQRERGSSGELPVNYLGGSKTRKSSIAGM